MKKRMPKKAITRREALGTIATGTAGATAALSDDLVGISDGRSRSVPKQPPTVYFNTVEDDWLDRLAREVAEKKEVLRRVRTSGVPDYKKQELCRKASEKIHAIDPDIAGLKSLSLGHKFRMQAAINYHKAVRDLGTDLKTEIDDLVYQIKHRIAYHVW